MNTYEVTYGNDDNDYEEGDWKQTADPWTLTITTPNGSSDEFAYWMGPALCREPEPEEILASLRMDASLGEQTFDNFCAELGYDSDSRKAYALWEQCQQTAYRLRLLNEPTEPTEEDLEL